MINIHYLLTIYPVGSKVFLIVTQHKVPGPGDRFIDKNGRIAICKNENSSIRAQQRPIVELITKK